MAADPQWEQVKQGVVRGAEGEATVAEQGAAHHQSH